MNMLNDNEQSNRVIKATINGSIGTITFAVRNAGEVTFHVERASKTNREYAEFHGWKQRLVDDAAGEKSPQAKLDAIAGLIGYYESGAAEWNQRGGSSGEINLLIRALIAAGLMVDSAEKRVKVREMSAKERAALAMHADVKPHLDAMRAEATSDVDTDTLLATL